MPEPIRPRRMQPSMLARLSLRLLWRDWRGGELRLLLLALIMAVTSVSGIALFTDRLQQALVLESANMLAADRVLSGREEAPEEWIEEAQSRGLETARFAGFSSMVFSDRGNILVAAKAVSDAYPLRGAMQVADRAFVPGEPVAGGPPPGEVWVESRILPALDVDVGDSVYVGEAELTVGRVIVQEPDRQQGGMLDNAGPRLMFHLADLPATNVIQVGSRVSWRYLFAGEAAELESYAAWLRERTAGEFRLRDIRDESQEVGEALERGERFLLLGSLFAVMLAGVAIALTARRYSERHFDYAAIMKTLGCGSTQVTAIYLGILLALLIVAIVLGSLLGWGVHHAILAALSSILPGTLPAASFLPFVLGALTALVCLFAFALPPLLALRNVSPLRVLRKDLDDASVGQRLPYLVGLAGAVFLVLWYSRDLLLTTILLVSLLGVLLVISLVSWVLLRSTAAVGGRAGSAWRLALSAARRRRRQSVLQIMVFAITIMSLLTLGVLRGDLISDWQAQLPEDVPNHFLMNVSQGQVTGIEDFLEDNGITPNPFYPMTSAGLLSINDELAEDPWSMGEERETLVERGAEGAAEEGEDEPRERRIANRQVTWVDELPADNRIVAGQWWQEAPEPGRVSVEEDYAMRLGITLGDVLEFEAGGQRFSAEVQSLRSVRWDNMQPNFFFIFSPGTLDAMGATYLSTVLLEGEEKRLLNELLREFPTIVVLELDALIEQIQDIINQVSAAIELIALLVLAAGALVLLACVNATLDERFRENAVLRALGAGKRLILNALAIEFAFIGLLAGLIATLGTEVSTYFLQTRVFGQEFVPHYWVWFAGPLSGMILIGTLGILATRKVVNTSPLVVLRDIG